MYVYTSTCCLPGFGETTPSPPPSYLGCFWNVPRKGFVAQQQPSQLEVYFGYPRHAVGAEQCACAEALGVLARLPTRSRILVAHH